MPEYTEGNISYEDMVNFFIAEAITKAGYQISVSTSRLADIIFLACNNGGDLAAIEQGIKALLNLLEEQVRNDYLSIEKLASPPVGEKIKLNLISTPQTGLFHPQFNPDIEQDIKGEKK